MKVLALRIAVCWLAPASLCSAASVETVACDIAVLGGSTSSLAAAITAAEAAPSLSVCFTEITDWPGGQMTSGGVPAIDFNVPNSHIDNQPASFVSAMKAVPFWSGSAGAPTPHGTCPPHPPPGAVGSEWACNMLGSGSEGACSVSTQCYRPNRLVEEWVLPRLRASKNLWLFLRTAVRRAVRDPSNGTVLSVEVVQRAPKDGVDEWSRRLSVELPDWYSAEESPAYSKRLLNISAAVFVEATELGDVLASAAPSLPFLQGIEAPQENSSDTSQFLTHCGQAQTLTFYAQRFAAAAPEPPQPLPSGGAAGAPWKSNLTDEAFRHTWSWRRALSGANKSLAAVNVGDITQQNLGNDLDTAYLFPPLEAVRAEAASAEGWRGGVNLTALRMLEDRYGKLRISTFPSAFARQNPY
eukprot:COSAG01_NODE_2165_length_8256_cov_22.675003_7_plen_412_part_00